MHFVSVLEISCYLSIGSIVIEHYQSISGKVYPIFKYWLSYSIYIGGHLELSPRDSDFD